MADIRRYKLEQVVTDAVDADGNPTGDYWRVLGAHIARQSDELESMRRMMVFFTVLTVLGLVAGLILGIIGVVEISHATSTTSDLPAFP